MEDEDRRITFGDAEDAPSSGAARSIILTGVADV
jgi:hypothetical protein